MKVTQTCMMKIQQQPSILFAGRKENGTSPPTTGITILGAV